MQGILFIVVFRLICCLTQQTSINIEKDSFAFVPAPDIIVYQFNGNYENLVPVTLSEDKTSIIAYPGPLDVLKMKPPISLKHGWWLDTRGISKNTAFLSITLEEYKTFEEAPSLNEMMKKVKAIKPFKRIMNCGNTPVNEELIESLKQQVRKRTIKKCTCVK